MQLQKPLFIQKLDHLKGCVAKSSPFLSETDESINIPVSSLGNDLLHTLKVCIGENNVKIEANKCESQNDHRFLFKENGCCYFVRLHQEENLRGKYLRISSFISNFSRKQDPKYQSDVHLLDCPMGPISYLNYGITPDLPYMWITYNHGGVWFLVLIKFSVDKNACELGIEYSIRKNLTELYQDFSLNVNDISVQFNPSMTEDDRILIVAAEKSHGTETKKCESKKILSVYSIQNDRFTTAIEISCGYLSYTNDTEHGHVIVTGTFDNTVTLYQEISGELQEYGNSFNVKQCLEEGKEFEQKPFINVIGSVRMVFWSSTNLTVIDPFKQELTKHLYVPHILLNSTVLFGKDDNLFVIDNLGHEFTLYAFR